MLKGRLPLVIAIVLGLLAGVIAWQSIERKRMEVQKGWNLVQVVVAGQDVPAGTTLDLDMIAQRDIPSQFVTNSIVRPESANLVVGQKVLVRLQTGDPIMWADFQSTRGFEKLSTIVHKKGRALTIDVEGSNSVGGWVRPNDKVDILGTFRDPKTKAMETVTLLQDMIVLATGKITGSTNLQLLPESDRTYSNITVLCLPEEAEILTLAENMGKLTLTLRNPEDLETMEERGRATIDTLLTGERIQALQRTRLRTIQVIRAGQKVTSHGPGHGG